MNNKWKGVDDHLENGEKIVSRYSNYILTSSRLLRSRFMRSGFEQINLADVEIFENPKGMILALFVVIAMPVVYALQIGIAFQQDLWGIGFVLNTAIFILVMFGGLYTWFSSQKECFLLKSNSTQSAWIFRSYGTVPALAFVDRLKSASQKVNSRPGSV